jgi:hypothetical protein
MRAFNPGGRFDSDFEVDSLLEGANADLQSPAGSSVLWWIYDPVNTVVDPVYDVGSDLGGRKYRGPYELPVLRAVLDQGSVPLDERGYYNGDTLHLTINAEEIEKVVPGVIGNPDLQNRGRILWLGEIFRPMKVQQRGIVKNRFSLVVVDAIEVMNDELINDPDFQRWAGRFDAPAIPSRTLNPHVGTIDPAYPIIEPQQ